MHDNFCCGEIFIFISQDGTENCKRIIESHKFFLQKIGYSFNGFIYNNSNEDEKIIIRLFKNNNRVLYAKINIKKSANILAVIFLINIPKNISLEWWLINERAFEIIYDSLKVE